MSKHVKAFWSVALLFLISGFGMGVYVVDQWNHEITRVNMAILSTLLIIVGMQLMVFGVIAKTVIDVHKEQSKMLKRIMDSQGEVI